MTEREWQSQVVVLARLLGWRTYHTHDSRRSDKGWPDLVLVRERLVIAELKTEKGQVSENQREWLRLLGGAGVEVYLWRPSDYDQVEKTLKRRRPSRGGKDDE